jgi:POLQ-like helicase
LFVCLFFWGFFFGFLAVFHQKNWFSDEHIRDLVLEVAPKEACLVFCPSRQICEQTACMLGRVFPAVLPENDPTGLLDRRRRLMDELRLLVGMAQRSVISGVAFHHAGLTLEERSLLEAAFSDGTLSVIACTATLAAGVNLPARRVIIRSAKVANALLSASQYRQMCGRAGRTGQSSVGESILCVAKTEGFLAQVTKSVLTTTAEDCCSALLWAEEGVKPAVLDKTSLPSRLILSIIASGIAPSFAEVVAL